MSAKPALPKKLPASGNLREVLAYNIRVARVNKGWSQETLALVSTTGIFPDGHLKLLHLWPVKLPQAGRSDYEGSGLMAMRAAASLSR